MHGNLGYLENIWYQAEQEHSIPTMITTPQSAQRGNLELNFVFHNKSWWSAYQAISLEQSSNGNVSNTMLCLHQWQPKFVKCIRADLAHLLNQNCNKYASNMV